MTDITHNKLGNDSCIKRMHYQFLSCIMLVLSITFSNMADAADLASELKNLEGYLVIRSEKIDNFDGCDYGEIIQFYSGRFVTCNEYGYQYAFWPDAVILVNPIRIVEEFQCEMLVEDKLYDIDCNQYMNNIIRSLEAILRTLDDESSQELRQYIRNQLRILGVQD